MNNTYYILEQPDNDDAPLLTATGATSSLIYHVYGSHIDEPLTFKNSFSEYNTESGTQNTQSSILFTGTHLLISEAIKQALENLGVSQIDFVPAIYLDGSNSSQENYFLIRYKEKIDCWCREKSDYSKTSITATGAHYIYNFHLNEDTLNNIPEKERLVFKMGKSSLGLTFVHERVANALDAFNDGSFMLTPVSDYEG